MNIRLSSMLMKVFSRALWVKVFASLLVIFQVLRLYLFMCGIPSGVRTFKGLSEWSERQLWKRYNRLKEKPLDFTDCLPPKKDHRYIILGSSGIVGGYIVQMLLARGTSPKNIRTLDIQPTERFDMKLGLFKEVEFIKTDVTSLQSVLDAFAKPWDPSVSHLPLTVFHAATAVSLAEVEDLGYEYPDEVNDEGTRNVLDASVKYGASILSLTSSTAVSLKPRSIFSTLWSGDPKRTFDILNESDYYQPLRKDDQYLGRFPASLAHAEKIVCDLNSKSFRTGAIRAGHILYGEPMDQLIGNLLKSKERRTFSPNIVQSLAHGANVAVAHLQHEAVLAMQDRPQAGRPFVITDPGCSVTYNTIYDAVNTLSAYRFGMTVYSPLTMLFMTYLTVLYRRVLRPFVDLDHVFTDVRDRFMKVTPRYFDFFRHVLADDAEAKKPVEEGGLGYKGVITTMDGVVQEVVNWQEHEPYGYNKFQVKDIYSLR